MKYGSWEVTTMEVEGMRFGRLVVVRLLNRDEDPMAICECECGADNVIVRVSEIGVIRSCVMCKHMCQPHRTKQDWDEMYRMRAANLGGDTIDELIRAAASGSAEEEIPDGEDEGSEGREVRAAHGG